MKKSAVILLGYPGAGKGTQADFIASQFDLIHFDSGRALEQAVHDPSRQREPAVRAQRVLFDSGKLLDTDFVASEIEWRVKKIAAADLGIVFSGSPRTLSQAHHLIPLIEKLYGKKNTKVILLKVKTEDSVTRNSRRLICGVCGKPVLTAYYPVKHPRHCPRCGGSLYKRTIDNPQVIKVRLNEFLERTRPILAYLKKRGYTVRTVDGSPAPYLVFTQINDYLKKRS